MFMIEHNPVTHTPVQNTLPTVDLSPVTEEGTYFIARLIMKLVDWILALLGMENNETLFTIIYAAIVFMVAWGLGLVVSWIVMVVVRKVGKHWKWSIYEKLSQADFFTKVARLIPAIFFLILLQFTLNTKETLSMWLTRFTWIYIVYIFVEGISVFATVLWTHFDERENTRRLPLKGFLQLVKGGVWIIGIIVAVAILFDRSPGSLLAGLGAFAAVLMLVFKDSILGLVAGVQLSQNDSLHVGDWIKVQGTNANGTVTEVNLTAVKVLNWDKTTTYLPPYSLISGSFTNYRSMQQSNTREIVRSYNIDADSVVAPDKAMLDFFETLPLVGEWVKKKRAQQARGIVEDVDNSEGLVNGSLDTNLGVFRAYIQLYLDSHPRVAHGGGDNYCFVTTLAQTPTGIPLQITCFTNTSAWLSYEAIQAAIFEHLAIMLRYFNLYTYEEASGRDTILEGYMSTMKNPGLIVGLPYPFFANGGTPYNPGYPVPAAPAPTDGLGGVAVNTPVTDPASPVSPKVTPAAPATTDTAGNNANVKS